MAEDWHQLDQLFHVTQTRSGVSIESQTTNFFFYTTQRKSRTRATKIGKQQQQHTLGQDRSSGLCVCVLGTWETL